MAQQINQQDNRCRNAKQGYIEIGRRKQSGERSYIGACPLEERSEYAQLHQDTGEIAGETQPPAQEGKGGAQA